MTTLKDLDIVYDKPNWCPGCGDFGIWISLKNAIVSLGLNPWEVVLVSGIGCSSKLPYWVKTYGFNGLHGRPMPVAEGIKLANKGLTVIVVAGDGDQYGEGLNHMIHAARRNIDLTLITHNNQIYGLTTGQFSPTTDLGEKNKANPNPISEIPLNPISTMLSAGATFIARGFAGDNKQETQLITEGIKHKGFAIIDTMQPCVTFNHKNTFAWFYERIYKLGEDYDPTNKELAFKKALEWPARHASRACEGVAGRPLERVLNDPPNGEAKGEKEKIPTGIIYKEERPTWEDATPQSTEVPLHKQPIDNIDINPLLEEFK